MSQQQPAEQPAARHARPVARQPRRGLLVGGIAALTGAVGATLAGGAQRASAAAGQALVLGRSNSASTSSTVLSTASSGTGFKVSQTGGGAGGAFTAVRNTGLSVATALTSRWALVATNTGTAAGLGGAVNARGGRGAGLLAETANEDAPAVVALGAPVAQVAEGESYLDGDALALRSWVAVEDPSSDDVQYAHVASGEAAQHGAHGTAVVPAGATSVTVDLPAGFVAATDTTKLTVTLTPVGEAMPQLHAVLRQAPGGPAGTRDAFTAQGAVAGGSVAWAVWAPRTVVTLPGEPAAATAARSATAATARRRTRRDLRLPRR